MAEITALVPAYQAAGFITHTLDALAGQTFTDIRVLISIDPGDDDTETVCRRYLNDPRFEIVVQPIRLGWIGNVNALLARVASPYFCLIPHDDVPAPVYCERLLDALATHAAAVCAYSDIAGFGSREIRLAQPPLTGSLFERAVDFLLHHFPAVAFRGLVARTQLSSLPRLDATLRGDFAADTVWMLQLALDGELHRVAEPLYAKRYGPATVHAGWFEVARDEIVSRWTEHAVVCTRSALTRFTDADERAIVMAAGLLRARGIGHARPEVLGPRTDRESASAAAQFCAALGTAPDLATRVRAHPRASAIAAALETSTARRRRRDTLLDPLRRVLGR